MKATSNRTAEEIAKEQKEFIVPFLNIFGMMETGKPVKTEDRNIVSAATDAGKLTISRAFEMDESTLLPIVSFSILFNDTKVYGMGGEFLTDESIVILNKQFLVHNRRFIHERENANNRNKEMFNTLFLG